MATPNPKINLTSHQLRTPRAAALAGILFAVLSSVSLTLIRLSVPSSLTDQSGWLEKRGSYVPLALSLAPFAGMAFLWFIGVIRDRLGDGEDRFFATVFFGSGLLYLALTFISAAVAGAILASYNIDPSTMTGTAAYTFGRALMFQASNIYALRMAGVFMISLSTIWLRTRMMPRFLVFLTYGLALVMLLGINVSLWITLIFPAWVFVISVFILILNFRRKATHAPDGLTVALEPPTEK